MSRSRRARCLWWTACALLAALYAESGIAQETGTGAETFASHCAVCHGPDAAGIPGSFPSLHEQIVAFGKTAQGRDYLVMVVTTGLMGELKVGAVSYRGVMPAQSTLSEADVAAVLSYLMSGRGNDSTATVLTAADVAAARNRHPDRAASTTRTLRPAFPES